ncbi:DUF6429 family protein [Pseudomonas putida]
MNRLHHQCFISNPVNRNKSIWLTEERTVHCRKNYPTVSQ